MAEKRQAGVNEKSERRKVGVGEKVLKGSFWVVAAVHITVFTVIGVTTWQWRLLVIFLIGFVAVMAAYVLLRLWHARARSRRKR